MSFTSLPAARVGSRALRSLLARASGSGVWRGGCPTSGSVNLIKGTGLVKTCFYPTSIEDVQSEQTDLGLCSHSSMFFLTALYSRSSMFPQRYVPTALYSHNYLFPQLHAPTNRYPHSSIVPQLCYHSSIVHSSIVPQFYSPQFYSPTAL